MIKIIIVFVVVFSIIFGGYFLLTYQPDTIKVCDEWGTEQYIQRAPSVGIPIGDSDFPTTIMIPVGDDVIKTREVCVTSHDIPNPNKK